MMELKSLKDLIKKTWLHKPILHLRNVFLFFFSGMHFFLFYIREDRCGKETKRCMQRIGSRNFNYPILGRNSPRCCASHLLRILTDLTNVLDKNEVDYFISYGTLLGSVRHGGMIPWDTDVDIGILSRDVEKIKDILCETLSNKYHIDMSNSHIIRVNYSKLNRLHVDCEVWHIEGNDLNFYDDIYQGIRSIPYDSVFPLKKYEFYDLSVKGPKTDFLLQQVYGDKYMTEVYRKWGFFKRIAQVSGRQLPAALDFKEDK